MTLSTRLLIGGLLGTITAFFAGWAIYDLLLNDFFEGAMLKVAGVMKDTQYPGIREWVALMISQASIGFLLAFIFSKFSSISLMKGLIAGGIIVMLIGLYTNCIAFFQMNLIGKKYIITDIFVSFIYGGIVGSVVGWYLGRSLRINSTPQS